MNQTDALKRIHEQIDGKDRLDRKERTGSGVAVNRVSMAEVDPHDVVAVAESISGDALKSDKRLAAILIGSRGAIAMGAEVVALKITDLDYLVTIAERPKPEAKPLAELPDVSPGEVK